MITRYQEWQFGERVWGMAQLDHNEKPISTPTIHHVLHYDYHIRKEHCRLMNLGHDFAAALEAAKKNGEIRAVHFISPASRDINSQEYRACSFPGLKEAYGLGSTSSAPPAHRPGGSTASKADTKKLRDQIKAEVTADLKRKFGLTQAALPAPPPHGAEHMSCLLYTSPSPRD